MLFTTRKTSFHLEYIDIVKRSKKAVQTVLWTINSSGSTKDTDLKYKTPTTPHHNDPEPLNKIPWKVFLFINY
jgi:hypothetical protein